MFFVLKVFIITPVIWRMEYDTDIEHTALMFLFCDKVSNGIKYFCFKAPF